jgi:hypothetical protein
VWQLTRRRPLVLGMLVRALAGMRASVQGSPELVQLTNAGLEICWKRAVRMHWRAGAAKERPASMLRDVYACRRVYGRGRAVGGGVDLQAKAAIPKAKAWRPLSDGDWPRELLERGCRPSWARAAKASPVSSD